jgi:rhodanese-related sulfurtransferase
MKTLIATFACALVAMASAVAGEYPDIAIADLEKAIKDGKVTVLDVNGSRSYSKGHIPGAIDFRANKDKIASVLPKDKSALVVAYCGGPSCSAYKAAAEAAEKLGYTNVKHLSAGISGWKVAQKPTEAADKS